MDNAGRQNEDGGGDEVELVFDDVEADLAAFLASVPDAVPDPAPAPAPPPAEAEAKPKKRPARGKALPEPEPAPVPAPAPVIEPAPPAPVAVAPPAPPAPVLAGRLLPATMMLAAFASVVSGVGVVVTARNLAVLSQAKSDTAERQAMLARLPALIASVERLRDAQRVELARTAALHPTAPVTLPELRRELDNTRIALGNSQPGGISALNGIVRAGQAELAHRIDELGDTVRAMQKSRQ